MQATKLRVLLTDSVDIFALKPNYTFASSKHGFDKEKFLKGFSEEKAQDLAIDCNHDSIFLSIKNADGFWKLVVYRGITTANEVFYLKKSSLLIIADSFRNILSEVSPPERLYSSEGVLDHYLFRCNPMEQTLISGIRRLGHGEALIASSWHGDVQLNLIERIDLSDDRVSSPELRVDTRVNSALASVISQIPKGSSTVNMLSGGVDSTLIHTYLGKDVPSIVFGNSQLTREDIKYSFHASDLLGTDHHLIQFRSEDYPRLMEDTTRTAALPIHYEQSVLHYLAYFMTHYDNFVCGQEADALFGSPQDKLVSFPFKFLSADCFYRLLPGVYGRIGAMLRQISKPISDTAGFALAKTGIRSDLEMLKGLFGKICIEERLAKREAYVRKRVKGIQQNYPLYYQHIEMSHLISYFLDGGLSIWKQIASSRGKNLITPFTNKLVVQTALSIPVTSRYIRYFDEKHVLKRLLKQRLPKYQVKKKIGTSLDRDSFADFFLEKEYPVGISDLCAERQKEFIKRHKWEVATLAIFDNIVAKGQIQKVHGTREIEWPAAERMNP